LAYIYIYIDLEELIPRLVDEPPNTIIKCSKLEAMYASRGNYIYIYIIYIKNIKLHILVIIILAISY